MSSACKGLGLWLQGLNRTCFCQAAWQGFCFVDVKLLSFEVCGSNWYLLGGDVGLKARHAEGASQFAVVHRAKASENC